MYLTGSETSDLSTVRVPKRAILGFCLVHLLYTSIDLPSLVVKLRTALKENRVCELQRNYVDLQENLNNKFPNHFEKSWSLQHG